MIRYIMVLGFRKKAAAEPIEAPALPTSVEDSKKQAETTGVAQTTGVDDEIVEETIDQLKKFQKAHRWDLNLPVQKLAAVDTAVVSDDLEKKLNVEHTLLEENSPYPEVAATVRNYDE